MDRFKKLVTVLGYIGFFWSAIRLLGQFESPRILQDYLSGVLPALGNAVRGVLVLFHSLTAVFDATARVIVELLRLKLDPLVVSTSIMLAGLCIPYLKKHWMRLRRNPIDWPFSLFGLVALMIVLFFLDGVAAQLFYANDGRDYAYEFGLRLTILVFGVFVCFTTVSFSLLIPIAILHGRNFVHPLVTQLVSPLGTSFALFYALISLFLYAFFILVLDLLVSIAIPDTCNVGSWFSKFPLSNLDMDITLDPETWKNPNCEYNWLWALVIGPIRIFQMVLIGIFLRSIAKSVADVVWKDRDRAP
ncbi:MAG: hypothetical protein AAFR51_07955 [Pseudomonadota bacterium]